MNNSAGESVYESEKESGGKRKKWAKRGIWLQTVTLIWALLGGALFFAFLCHCLCLYIYPRSLATDPI
jgi:hypothetical protein